MYATDVYNDGSIDLFSFTSLSFILIYYSIILLSAKQSLVAFTIDKNCKKS